MIWCSSSFQGTGIGEGSKNLGLLVCVPSLLMEAYQ